MILLSTYDKDDLPADARTAGALAYVHKESFGPDILRRHLGRVVGARVSVVEGSAGRRSARADRGVPVILTGSA